MPVSLDWEEGVYKGVLRLVKALRPKPPVPANAAHLAPHLGELTALAQVVSGLPLKVSATHDEGGVRGLEILLPELLTVAPTVEANEALYRIRAVLGAAIIKEGDQALEWLHEELPAFAEAWMLAAPYGTWGRVFTAGENEAPASEGGDTSLPEGREAKAPRVTDLSRTALDDKAQEDKVLVHSFEKVDTVDSFDGNTHKADGADELDAELEALEEVDLGALVRDGTRTQAILKADVGMEAGIAESTAEEDARGIPYDEWDRRKKAYRKGWCRVIPGIVRGSSPAWGRDAQARHRGTIQALRHHLEHQRTERRTVGRERDGEHPDLDALVDHLATVQAGHTGGDRLYVRSLPRRRDVATTVLLDLSLSSDSWVDDRRVLDVSRDAILVLGEVADELGDRLEVLAFSSATRNRCHVWTLKSWDDPWERCRDRLGALEPQGYTRIGAALRHATFGLAHTPAESKLLLLVSDGKPTDLDRYEGRHGTDDIRMALREADRVGVKVHALAVDRTARHTLPEMLGPGRGHVVAHADDLVPALTRIYGELTRG
jgi:nitric oxide reductase activation protein